MHNNVPLSFEQQIENLILFTFDAGDSERSQLIKKFIHEHQQELNALKTLSLKHFYSTKVCRGVIFVFADILKYCPKLELIDFNLSNIQTEDFILINDSISKLSRLNTLRLDCVFSGDAQVLETFFKILPKNLTQFDVMLYSNDDFKLIGQFLSTKPHLKTLCVNSFLVTGEELDHSVIELLYAIAKLNTLEEFSLLHNFNLDKFDDKVVIAAIEGLVEGIQNMSNLKKLAMNYLCLHHVYIKKLSKIFGVNNLQSLALTLGDYTASVASIFNKGKHLVNLKELSLNVPYAYLSDIVYGQDEVLISRAGALQNFISKLAALEILQLQNFDTHATFSHAITKAIGKISSLKSLEIDRFGPLSDTNLMQLFFQNLAKQKNLESLQLSATDVMESTTVLYLSQALQKLPKLKLLEITELTISHSNIDAFVSAIGALKQLKSLCIRIKTTDIHLVEKYMKVIGSLTTPISLNLSNNMLCEYATLEESIIRPLGKLINLKALDLRANNIGSMGANILTKTLLKLPQLEKLDLSSNKLTYQNQISLIDTLKKLPKLSYSNVGEISVNSLEEEKKMKDHFSFQPLYNSYILYWEKKYEALLPSINDITMIRLEIRDSNALYDNIDADYIYGIRLQHAGYLTEALSCYNKILNSGYKRGRIYLNIGNILLRLDRYKESLDIFDQGLQNMPKDNFLLFGKATALYQLAKFSEALEIYIDLRLELAKYDKVYNYSLLANIGATYLQLKDYGKAFEVLLAADKQYNALLGYKKGSKLHENNLNKAMISLHHAEEYVPLIWQPYAYFPWKENIVEHISLKEDIRDALLANNLLQKGKKVGIGLYQPLHQQAILNNITIHIGVIVEVIDCKKSKYSSYDLICHVTKHVYFDLARKVQERVHFVKIHDFACSNIRVNKLLQRKFNNLVKLYTHYHFIQHNICATRIYQYLYSSHYSFQEKIMLVLQNILITFYDENQSNEFGLIIANNISGTSVPRNTKLLELIDNLSNRIESAIYPFNKAVRDFPIFNDSKRDSNKSYTPCVLLDYVSWDNYARWITEEIKKQYHSNVILDFAKAKEVIILHKHQVWGVLGVGNAGPLIFGIRCYIRNTQLVLKDLVKIQDITVCENRVYAIPINYQFKIKSSEKDKVVKLYNTISALYQSDYAKIHNTFSSIFAYAPYNANLEQVSIEEYIHSKAANLVVDCDLNVAEDASLLDVLKLIEEVFKKHLAEEEIETTEIKPLENSEEKQAESEGMPQEKQEYDVIVSKFAKWECQISERQLPEHVHEYLMKELQGVTDNNDRESKDREDRIRNFLDLPWNKYDQEEEDLKKVQNSLDKYHYGLSEIKEEILDYLANKDKTTTPILCLVGAPGIGKTSVAEAIAKSVGRKCVKLNLGGMYDQSLIRGHHYTYVSATCGQPLSLIRQAGTWNPVMILDEIDKVAVDRGDVNSALLALLDPTNNHEFTDDYYDVPLDMSKIMYLATANDISQIPYALRSRMHIIQISGYTEIEKMGIIKQYVLPSIMEHYAKEGKSYKIPDKVIQYLLHHYVQESGVRDLKRKIQKLINRYYREEKTINACKQKFDISFVHKTLGKEIYLHDKSAARFVEGLVNGLSCSAMGGDLLPIEVVVIPGKGEIKTTGSLGDVLKESIQIAITTVKRNLQNSKAQNSKTDNNIDKYQFMQEAMDKHDIHVNCIKGSIPKEGPSAGIALYTGIYSALTGFRIRQDIAMTGEIGLLGNVLTIGGLKEKICAAIRESMKIVIVPQKNAREIDQLPDEIKSAIEIKTIANVSEIHSLVFEQSVDNNVSQKAI